MTYGQTRYIGQVTQELCHFMSAANKNGSIRRTEGKEKPNDVRTQEDISGERLRT